MTLDEHDVRAALTASATATRLSGDAASQAWLAGRRRARQMARARGGIATLGVILVAAGGLVVAHAVQPTRSTAVLAGQSEVHASANAGLDAVRLPDPAPGFPVRRQPDRPAAPLDAGGRRVLVRQFLVATATGAQATVEVARAGDLPPAPRGGTTVGATVAGFDVRASGTATPAQLTALLDSLTGLPAGRTP